MAIRDVELDVATILEASVASPTLELATNLYAGAFPANAPDQMVVCRFTGGGSSEEYLGTGQSIFAPEVQVMVRGNRDAYKATLDLAAECFSALHLYQAAEYIKIKPEGAGPNYMGADGTGRPSFVFQVALSYLAAGAPGTVVPLTQQSAVVAATGSFSGDVQVDGDLNVDGALTVNGEPVSLSDIVFPEYEFDALPLDADPWTGAIVTDRDNALHIFDGADWKPVLGGNYRTELVFTGTGDALDVGEGLLVFGGGKRMCISEDAQAISFNGSNIVDVQLRDPNNPIVVTGSTGNYDDQPAFQVRTVEELVGDDEWLASFANVEAVKVGIDKDGGIGVGILPTASLPPAAQRKGFVFYDDTLSKYVYSDGTSWLPVSEAVDLSAVEADIAANAAALTAHEADTSTHGVAGAIVGTTDTQTLTNKTFSDALKASIFAALDTATATIRGAIANGASAVAVVVDSLNSLTTTGAKLLSIRNAGSEKAFFDKDGQLNLLAASGTYALRVPAGNCYVQIGSGYIYGDASGGRLHFDTGTKISQLQIPELGSAYLAGPIENYSNQAGGFADAIRFNASLRLKSYTVATVPSASHARQGAGAMIYVTDGNAGSPCVAVSDGTNWKVIALGATISS